MDLEKVGLRTTNGSIDLCCLEGETGLTCACTLPLLHTGHLSCFFSRTPVPFGGPYVGETIFQAGTPFVPEPFSGLELLRLRPSFNRVAQGWVRKLPESEEL